MLVIISNPSDQPRLDPSEWEIIVHETLAGPRSEGLLEVHTIKATRRDIRNALLAHRPDIIQVVGHGVFQNGKGYLALVDEDSGNTWLVDDAQFADLFLGFSDNLSLLCLAACESGQSSNPQGFAGIAPQLVQRGVPAVVAMQYKVQVKTAKVFLEDFYAAVAAHKPIDWAIQSARNAISQMFGVDNREFAAPVLYMRAGDGAVL